MNETQLDLGLLLGGSNSFPPATPRIKEEQK